MLAHASTFGLDGWAERAVLVGIVAAATILAFGLIRLITPRLARRAASSSDPGKWQQRRTAVTLLATMLRYVVLVAAIVGVIAIVAGAGSIGALGGSAVVAVTVALATQRLLTDVIAGFFILFEGQYAVGDTIAVEPSKIVGVVEELGVRTTLIHEPDGSRSYVPNGQITAVRRYPGPQTTLVVTVLSRDEAAAEAALRDLSLLAAPTSGIVGSAATVEQTDVGDGVSLVSTTVGASATLAGAAERLILATLRARLGDRLAGDPVVVPLERTRNLTGPVAST